MKLTVVLARYPEGTPRAGELAAYVVRDECKRGRNLLAGMHITQVHYAKTMSRREIDWLIPGMEIEFEGPEGENGRGNGK